MKTLPLLVLSFVCCNVVFAQELTTPKKEFEMFLAQNVVDIKPGETKAVAITLQRSRSYSKLNADMNLSSSLPEGIQITFDPRNGAIENTTAIITATETARPGNYTIIVNCTINHKNKGSMLKLNIKTPDAVTTGL